MLRAFAFAQVERIAEAHTIPARAVKIPGIFVDCVVVADPEDHMTNLATQYHAGYAGRIRVPATTVPPLPLDERKIIARRAAFELPPNGIVNLGVGVPEGVASVANEEKVLQYITLSVESGAIGGIPASGASFGASLNMDAIIDENQQFDFYDGGGLDLACLGMAECDRVGNVNVSRFGSRLIGIGGFINISQNARRVVFAGAFTAGGLEVAVEDGKLKILKEGREKKFVDKVGQISFSGQYAYDRSRPVLYVTERCVFRRVRSGLALIEVAPGIDIERDILAHMDFKPIISEPDLMDPRIFHPSRWGSKRTCSISTCRTASLTILSATSCSSISWACISGSRTTSSRCANCWKSDASRSASSTGLRRAAVARVHRRLRVGARSSIQAAASLSVGRLKAYVTTIIPSQRYLKFQDGGASRCVGYPRMVETRRVWRSE